MIKTHAEATFQAFCLGLGSGTYCLQETGGIAGPPLEKSSPWVMPDEDHAAMAATNWQIDRRGFGILAGSLFASASFPSLSACGSSLERDTFEQVKSTKKLRIGAIPDGAPYYERRVDGSGWSGFYIDICTKLAADLGAKIEIVETTWGNSVLDLQADKIDIFFGLNPTPSRAKVIDFSAPVFNNAYTFLAAPSVEARSWIDFDTPSMRIAVDAGSSHDAAVTSHTPKAQISRLKTASDATSALQSGRVDAQCLILLIALAIRAKNPGVGNLIVPTPVDFTTSTAGLKKTSGANWANYVNTWIANHRQNGFINETIIRNMALVGVKSNDFPAGLIL